MIVDTCVGGSDVVNVFTFNATAAWIWEELADTNFTITTVATLLTSHYDVGAEQAAIDAEKLVNTWLQYGLVSDN